MTEALKGAIEATIEEGEHRLTRSWSMLLATGTLGGIDVGMGVFGLLLVRRATHNELLGGLAFSIGFISLALANSELFTENFLVPLAAVVDGRGRPLSVVRLWAGTWATNLIGGWIITFVVIKGLPFLRPEAVKVGSHFVALGVSGTSLASGVLAGAVITLMTWMQQGTESVTARIVAAIAAGFLLGSAGLNHAIVLSLNMFAALHSGAPFGYLDWLRLMFWAALGNMVGGIGLVSMLRLVQVKAHQRANEPV